MKKTRTAQKPKNRNFVAKHVFNKSGAGRHADKKGKRASRCRQKRAYKADISADLI